MFPFQSRIAGPFIGVHIGSFASESLDVFPQGFAISMFDNPQANSPALASNRTNDRRTVIIIGTMSTLLVRATTRRIA
jgi:hypothetical protein